MSVEALKPIREFVGPIQEVALLYPHSSLPWFAPDDPAWSWQQIVVSLKDITIKTHADLDSPIIGHLKSDCLCRVIGTPRVVANVIRAKMEAVRTRRWDHEESLASSLCGGYVSLSSRRIQVAS
eukprot:4163120-Amphidinium_carterae.2